MNCVKSRSGQNKLLQIVHENSRDLNEETEIVNTEKKAQKKVAHTNSL